MSQVILHIGALKSGTTFIQTALTGNKDKLASRGVLWPGSNWSQQVAAVDGLRGAKGSSIEDWEQLLAEIDRWEGGRALISMELLSLMGPQKVNEALDSLAAHEVRVVLTVRDLGRTIPAQWQESLQNGFSWTYQEYLDGLMAKRPRGNEAGRHFWRRHDWPQILTPWIERLGREAVVVVTVPPSGAPRHLLWSRFCEAIDLAGDDFVFSPQVNESLGATSAQVMEHVARRAKATGAGPGTYSVMKHVLAKRILAKHRAEEPPLVLPDTVTAWAVQRTERLVSAFEERPARVVGDFADLTPVLGSAGRRREDVASSGDPASEEALTRAADAIVDLCGVVAERIRPGKRGLTLDHESAADPNSWSRQ